MARKKKNGNMEENDKRSGRLSRQEAAKILYGSCSSQMAEPDIEQPLKEYHRKHFGVGAFLFYFGASLLAQVVFQIILSVLPQLLNF